MCSHREAEDFILTGLQEVKSLEMSLDRRLADLGGASQQTRVSFLLNLIDLEKKAERLEQFVNALERPRQTKPVAA